MIAVDGTSGSGKSSTSRGVAERLGLRYLDTGAMFRAMTWWLLSQGVDVHDPDAVAAVAGRPRIESGTETKTDRVGRAGPPCLPGMAAVPALPRARMSTRSGPP